MPIPIGNQGLYQFLNPCEKINEINTNYNVKLSGNLPNSTLLSTEKLKELQKEYLSILRQNN